MLPPLSASKWWSYNAARHYISIFRVDMFIHQRWMESRLEISDDIFEEGDDYVTLLPEFFDNLWQPDPYFLNSKIAGKPRWYTYACSFLELLPLCKVFLMWELLTPEFTIYNSQSFLALISLYWSHQSLELVYMYLPNLCIIILCFLYF